MNKIKVAIIGSGNIGMNLLYKIKRSGVLECVYFIGRNSESENLSVAKHMGYRVSHDSIEAIIREPDCCDIVFDATSAESHRKNASILRKMDKFVVDLTPSKVGKLCIPCLNWEDSIKADNVNMITCGGQAMVPIAYALKKACSKIKYLETVSTISSISAGAGTRQNIDEYVKTTSMALKEFTGISNTKAMIVLNPAEPPIIMRNTLYAVVENPDINKMKAEVKLMEKQIQQYIPGYRVIIEPTIFDEGVITVTVQVEGSGDFLPSYAGNLDIITCAGIEIAEHYARNLICKEEACPF